MTAFPFDTHKLAKSLEAGGFTPQQASAAVEALASAASAADLATKADLADLATKADLLAAKADLRVELSALEMRLTLRMGGIAAVAVGVILAAIRYMHP